MTRTGHAPGRRAFTLIEMLVVIIIVGILVTLVVAVGAKVTTSARASATRDVIRALDTSLEHYIADSGEDKPKGYVAYEENMAVGNRNFPIMDGVVPTSSGGAPINSVGYFLLQAKAYSSAIGVVEGLDSNFVHLYTPTESSGTVGMDDEQPELTTVFDAWGNPIRYVHPLFDGEVVANPPRADCQPGTGVNMRGTTNANNGYFFGESPIFYQELAFMRVRRNYITERERNPAECPNYMDLIPGDGDGGECVGGRPYFYSAGPDADPSDREDNVYTTEPRFIKPGE
ncbi:MAG: prepilin-type N-terminal cleavage/methylation domain-containing protein [Phycisphaerales bacterium]